MRRGPAVLAAAVVLAAVTPGPSAAAPRSPALEPVADRVAAPATDGERFAVWAPFRGRRELTRRLEVLDTATGARRRIARPRGCFLNEGAPTASVTPAGQALLFCPGDTTIQGFTNRLADLRGRGSRELPGTVGVDGRAAEVAWSSVGRRWVQGELDIGDGAPTPFHDWRTGKTRLVPEGGGPRDLDSRRLAPVRFCRRARARDPQALVSVYERPFFLAAPGRSGFERIELRSCDGPRRVLDRRGAADGEVRLSGGLATWPVDSTRDVKAYDVRTRQAFAWRVPRSDVVYGPAARILPTRRFVLIAATSEESCDKTCDAGSARLYRARVRP